MLKPIDISESLGSVAQLSGTRYKVRLIEGDKLGSSAYYPADVIMRDGPKVFKRGTPMFLDHQSPEEKAMKPFGSISSFVGELAEDAYYENDGLYAEVEVFEDAAPIIKARKDRIGVSVRATVVGEPGLINGKTVPIAKQFTEARSVDFVMRAGAGGKIVSILESAIEETPEGEIEESGDTMPELAEIVDGVTAAIASKFDARFEAIESKIAPAEVEESADDTYAKALEIAEAFAGSSLDADGRARVLDLHKANGKPIAELIAAEEAYVKTHIEESAETEGVEENDGTIDAEESAITKITVPTIGAWSKK